MSKVQLTLMNKDIAVMELYGEFKPISPKINIDTFEAEKANILNERLKPIYIQPALLIKTFNEWFSKRLISAKRNDIPEDKILWKDDRPHYFSMSDQYWLKYDDNESWKDFNFFTNHYSSLTGDTFFTKNLAALNPAEMYYNTPDITTNGIMKKRWIKDENNINTLIKHSSQKFKQEVLNEILASKLLSHLKIIPYVNYTLCISGYDICCKCKNFVTPNTEFVPAFHIYQAVPYGEQTKNLPDKDRTYKHLIEAIDYFKIPGAKDFIDKMLIVDQMMMNDDRHLGNFGFLRNVNTGEFIEPAPLFDFGNAFFDDESRVNKTQHIFKDRIQYLFDNKQMQPLTHDQLNDFKKSMDSFYFLTKKKKDSIMNSFAQNNDFIKDNLLKNQENSVNKKDKSNILLEDSF